MHISIKVHFLFSLGNLGGVTDEQGEILHHDMREMKRGNRVGGTPT